MEDAEEDLKSIWNLIRYIDGRLEMNDDPLLGDVSPKRESTGDWVEMARDVAYKLEDIIESHMYDVAECGGFDDGGFHNILKKYWCKLRIAEAYRKATAALETIRPEVKEIMMVHETLVLRILSGDPRVYSRKDEEKSSSSIGGQQKFSPTKKGYKDVDDEFFSLDGSGGVQQKKLLEGWIFTTDDYNVRLVPRCMCIAIWGMGGLGKTTLLEQIFYRNINLRKQFDCFAWITVSKTYKFVNLLRELFKKLVDPREMDTSNKSESELAKKISNSREINIGDKSEEDLIDMIHDIIDRKAYLIVFYDVWQDDFWSEVQFVFRSCDNPRSRILFTTRDKNVALSVAEKERVMQLSHLNPEQAWSLFCKKVFWKEDSPWRCPQELESVGKRIVQKCKGLPLAIVTVASMIFTKERNVSVWEQICSMLSIELGKKLESSIFTHSYNDLTLPLQHCFLYCCAWPEDWTFDKDYIISLWVAEEFIEEKTGMTPEEIGGLYIKELLGRSMMIEVFEENYIYPRYKIHGILRVIGLGISEDQKFGTIVNEDHANSSITGAHLLKICRARRLKICKAIEEIPYLPKLRTLSLLEINELKISFQNFKLLKVLELRGLRMSNIPMEIFQLFNLRFLDLSETGLMKETDALFPSEISRLRNLIVLDISETGVKRLPREMGKLQKLRRLVCGDYYGSGVQVPTEVFCLKNLQCLKYIEANEGDHVIEQLGNLTQLRQLGIKKVKRRHEKQLCSSLKRMEHLKELDLETAEMSEAIDLESLKDIHPRRLERISLKGAIKGIPTWFKSLDSLRYLAFGNFKLPEGGGDLLDSLKSLPFLEYLGLANAFQGTKLSFPSSSFPSLRELRIVCFPNLSCIEIEDSALPNLRKLMLCSCPELRVLPQVGKPLEIILEDMPILPNSSS